MLMNEVGENVGRLEVGMDVTWAGMEWRGGGKNGGLQVVEWR